MADTLTSELEAINAMLNSIGEASINTLSGTLPADVSLARGILKRIRRTVLSRGWNFNTEEGVQTSLDGSSNVVLPPNTMKVEPTYPDALLDVVQRGTKLYDKLNHTYVFTKAPILNFVYLLDWDELPEQARHYIAMRSARVFQAQTIGAQELDGYTKVDEAMALSSLIEADEDSANYNYLTNGAGRFYEYRR